ncbi:hypothetical protein CONPUDRAFT_169442 [Coniophora puteana RWD-64-598 SS2]|uniref:Uncharacterized protein n=1 Tax=Coniophora puteana (strain RWD-64-598) TaxID=741705 RepID=A0A5M3M8U6_CONPW|nr:uncharacterized protein CONPUDRAFT_169442 [Coniophora puteana RWD-64-598 SS2]EIW75692.1 hypothetical protein CONPUDRAFT_169442 [Coniophora puteana RWD-64-598 SS2]
MRSFASLTILLSVAIGAFAAPIQPIDSVVGTLDGQIQAGLKDVGSIAGSLTGSLKISRDELPGLSSAEGAVTEAESVLKQLGQEIESATGSMKVSRQLPGGIDVTSLSSEAQTEIDQILKQIEAAAPAKRQSSVPVPNLTAVEKQVEDAVSSLEAEFEKAAGSLKVSRQVSDLSGLEAQIEAAIAEIEKDAKASAESVKVSRQLGNIQGDIQTAIDQIGVEVGELTGIHASRAAAPQSVPQIWAALMKQITPVAESLMFTDANNVTEAVASLEKLQAPLETAIKEVRALAGAGLDLKVLLQDVDGVLDVNAFAKTLAADAATFFKALINVFKLADKDAKKALGPLVIKTATLLSQYLTVVSAIVTGLFVELAPLLLPLSTYLQTLGLTAFATILQYGSKL